MGRRGGAMGPLGACATGCPIQFTPRPQPPLVTLTALDAL